MTMKSALMDIHVSKEHAVCCLMGNRMAVVRFPVLFVVQITNTVALQVILHYCNAKN